jgi:DNA mismatch repair ATPase MutS
LTLTSAKKDGRLDSDVRCALSRHGYLGRLVRKERVAICDQVEDARKAKGLVRRESPASFRPARSPTPRIWRRGAAFLAAVSRAGLVGGVRLAFLDDR